MTVTGVRPGLGRGEEEMLQDVSRRGGVTLSNWRCAFIAITICHLSGVRFFSFAAGAGAWAVGLYCYNYVSSLRGLLFLFRRRCWGVGGGALLL